MKTLSTRFPECADRLRPSANTYELQRQGQQAKNSALEWGLVNPN